MAQSNNGDLFSFVIEPEFDTGNIKDHARMLEKELKEIAERISTEIADKMGDAFQFPANFDMTDINQVMRLVSQLGGEVTRTGTQINASFKDVDGNIVKVTGSIENAISKIKNLREKELSQANAVGNTKVATMATQELGFINQYENTGMTYGGSDQIKDQNELQQQILHNLQQEYQLSVKIADANRDGDQLKAKYYNDLLSNSKLETDALKNGYQGTMDEISATEQLNSTRLIAYQNYVQQQKSQSDAHKTEQKNIQDATTLMKQYYTTRSNMDKMEANGQSGGNYWNEQKQEIDSVTQKLEQYGITVDQTTGKLNFDSQSKNAQQLGQNLDKVNTTLEQGNTALDQRRAKMADQAPITAIQEYGKQLKVVNELESNNKTGTQAYKDSKAALDALEQELAKYGITIKTATDGTKSMEAAQGTQATQTEACTQAMQNFNAQQQNGQTASDGFGKSIEESVANFIKYQVALEALNKLVSEFTSAIKDMDDAMTQVRMVTMGSYEDTVKLSQQYGELAQKLGTTVTTVAEGADAWLRQGYNAKDAMTMLKASTTLAIVGQMNAADATDQLTA